MDLSDEGLYTVLADNGRGLPADARVTLAVDDALEKQIPGDNSIQIYLHHYIIKIIIEYIISKYKNQRSMISATILEDPRAVENSVWSLGSTAILNCLAYGNPKPSVTW